MFEQFGIAGLAQKQMRGRQRARQRVLLCLAGEEDSNHVRTSLLDLVQKLQSIHTGHSCISDDGVHPSRAQDLQSALAAVRELHLPLASHGIQASAKSVQYV